MNLPLFIAKKIYNDPGDKRKVSRPAIQIATLGVAIGLAVMIISVCVVLGFKHTIRNKAIGFGSHINVGNFMTLQGGENYPIVIDDSVMKVMKTVKGVKHVQRFASTQGILKTDTEFLGVSFKGIAQEYDTLFLHDNLVEGTIPSFSDNSGKQKILISKIMSNQLGLHAGDRVFAYFFTSDNVRARRFEVSGVYETNLSMFDKTICFTDLYTAVRLNGWESDQVSGAEIKVDNFNKIYDVENIFVEKINRTTDHYGETYSSVTVQEANPQIFSWLELLDVNVWIILALMVCVAGITMISGLLIIILERTNMIGTLKALGAKNGTVRHTFLWFATFMIGKGLIFGNILGIGLVILQKLTGLFKLDAATYYVNTVPVEINIPLIILINIATLLISVFVLIAPSYLISHIHPAKSMRYE